MATTTNEARLRLTAQDDTGRGMASAARNMRRTADEAERQSRRIETAQRRQQAAIAGAGAAVGAALGGAAAARIAKDSYLEFGRADRAIGRIANTAGKTKQEMAGVSRSMAQMAQKYALPLDTITEGLDALTTAGRSLEDSMDFLPSVAAAAQASGAAIGDIAASGNAVAEAMGFTSKQMQHVFDVMIAGGEAGRFELKDMARYLPQLAPMAAAVGYKGEEGLKKLVAILQVVRKQTGDAGQAADATRDVFAKMNSEEVANNFKELGNFDLKGTMEAAAKAGKDLPSTFIGFTRDVLTATANGADPLLKLPLLFKDVQMQNGMRALLSQPGAVKELVKQLNNVDGTTAKNLFNITEDAAAATQRLETSWIGVQRALGAALAAAQVPKGLDWLTEKLKESAAGFDQLSRLGFGAIPRALNRDAVTGLQGDQSAKQAEIDAASGPAKARLEAELREIEERLALAKGRFDRSDTLPNQQREGLPGTPDLPGPLSPDLLPPGNKPLSVEPGFRQQQFRGPGEPDNGGRGGLYNPASFDETAQEDTQKRMATDIAAMRNIWSRAIGPNAPSGRFGGLFQKASLGSGGDGAGDGAGGGDSTGSGPNIGFGGAGRFGGLGGAGAGGGGGGGGASFRRGDPTGGFHNGGGFSGGGGRGRSSSASSKEGKENVGSWQSFFQKPVAEGGLGMDKDKANAMVAMMQGESGANLNAGAYNPNDAGKPSGGTAQWRDDRLRNLKAFAAAAGDTSNNGMGGRDTQQKFLRHEMLGSGGMGGGSERAAYDAVMASKGSMGALRAGIGAFERPQNADLETVKRSAYLRGLEGDGENAGGAEASTVRGRGSANYMHGQHGGIGENLTKIRSPGGKTASVNAAAAPHFQSFINELEAQGYKINSLGGFNDRNKRGGTSKSQHAYGNAIDINPARNGFMKPRADGSFDTDMPKGISDLADKHGLTWGGDWKSVKDAMHFEWTGRTPEEKAKVAADKAKAKAAGVEDGHEGHNHGPGMHGKAEGDGKKAAAPGLDQGGSGFKPAAAPPLTPNQNERLRERPSTQARRETDREVRNARLNTYSDVGVA